MSLNLTLKSLPSKTKYVFSSFWLIFCDFNHIKKKCLFYKYSFRLFSHLYRIIWQKDVEIR